MAKKEGYVIIHKNGNNYLSGCLMGKLDVCVLSSKKKEPLFYATQQEADKVYSSLSLSKSSKSNWSVKKKSLEQEYTNSIEPIVQNGYYLFNGGKRYIDKDGNKTKNKNNRFLFDTLDKALIAVQNRVGFKVYDNVTGKVVTASSTSSSSVNKGYYLFNGKEYFVTGKEPTTDKQKRTVWTNKKNAKKNLTANPGFAMYKNDDDSLCEQAVSVANTSEDKLYHLYDASAKEYVLLADGEHATFKSIEAAASYKSALDCMNPGNGFRIYDEKNNIVQTDIPQMLSNAITKKKDLGNSSIEELLSHVGTKHTNISSKRPVCEEVDKQIESISVIVDDMQKRYLELNSKVDLCNKLFVDIHHLFEFTDYASDAEAAKAMYMFQSWLRQRREMKDTMEKIEMCAGLSDELKKVKKQFMNMKKRTYVPRTVDELFKDFM